MKVFNCIFGIFSIFAAIYCIFFPGLTFLNSGWIVTVLLGAWGICAIFDYASNKSSGKSKSEAAVGTLGLVAGIAAAVLSVVSLFIPGIRLLLDTFILCIFAGWLFVSGINSIADSFKVKKTGSKSWILSLILGILVLLAAIYGIFNLIFLAQTLGLVIGFMLMTYGIRLIMSVFEKTDGDNGGQV
ncbi:MULTISPECIES: DUF308 domain-containing protein [unclassified Ruminococcus]|uniref:DUF308 domain-containing protein n=1 Tax=unclassified Ruminococcus TaxID=2608920 RepID=UPI00210A0028|nr:MULTISPECIES: DUF308 domain-containing protein [unclassified Ruminococcus]MCQ4022571.1 hypothetical protein [Ruminococcus sp. zg-924]MCQ4114811.1 hypothetical protein [Ruminococcus sp. zg-921]